MIRQDVYKAIDSERDYQNNKWGDLDSKNSLGDFLIYMEKALHNAKHSYFGQGTENISLHNVRQVVAIAVAAMEKFGVPSRIAYTIQKDKVNESSSL